MATSEALSSIYLRPALNSTVNAGLVTTLAAFSPDIIPLDQVKATPAQLVSSYNSFVAHTIDLDEPSTLVYIRGKQRDGSQSVVTLRAVPNELVLWPQVWGSAKIIGQTGFKLDETINHNQVAVGIAPIPYTPIRIASQGHSHVTFIATSANPKKEFSAPPVKNWRDLVERYGKNTSLAFYNVQTADSCSRKTTLTSRFRLIENEAADVELFFGLETTGIPTSGIEASLNVVGKNPDKSGFSFAIDRQPLSQTGVYGKYIKVPSGFEGNVNLEVFNGDLKVFGDYSSISIVVYAVGPAGDVLLGAEHLVFDSNPRVKKLALSFNENIFSSQEVRDAANASSTQVATGNQGVVSSVFSGITGFVKRPFAGHAPNSAVDTPPFFFRGALGDTSVYPRTANPQTSPDIQPLGTVQDPNPAVTLGNFTVDVASQRKIALVSNTSNYVYLRATSTTAISGRTRLFFVNGSILLHPVQYSQPSHVVFDVDPNTNEPVTAIRPYETFGPSEFVITTPFTMDNLPPPADNGGGDHYCLVGESLADGEDEWPHEKVANFATSAEYITWLLTEPCVSWRNILYVQNPDPDDQTLQTSFEIPQGYAPTDQFQFQVQATNCPIGSSFSVTSDDPSILFPDTPVVSNPTVATSAFTGKSPGFSVQVTIHYHSHGHPTQTGQSLNAVLIQIVPQTALVAQVAATVAPDPAAIVARNVVTLVGESYPNVIDRKAPKDKDGRLKIGGAIRARAIGEAHDDPFDFVIPILRGIVIGTDRIRF